MLLPGERLDVVLFGATGVTGGNAVEHLGRRAAALGLRWGVAGRRPQKLMQRAAELPVDQQPQVLEADLSEPITLAEMAASARVVINAVGPYRLSAEPVIAACVQAAAHYLDVTGETDVVAEMIQRFDGPATDAGVRIVQAAGYEALPFDLAVALAAEVAAQRGARLTAVDAIASFALPPGLPRPSDGVSGGTFASTVAAVRGGRMDTLLDPASMRARATAPWACCRGWPGPRSSSRWRRHRSPTRRSSTAPPRGCDGRGTVPPPSSVTARASRWATGC